MRAYITLLMLVVSAVFVRSQEQKQFEQRERPVWAAYTLRAGSAHQTDTYLSPIKYSGQTFGLGYSRLQAMKFNPEQWVQQLDFGVDFDHTTNLVGNATMWRADIDLEWGMMRRWRLNHGFSAGVGGMAELTAGAIYLARNGNNPVAAKAALTLDATAYVTWNGHLGSVPVTIRYQAVLPTLGAFFAPDYGELYYEIYLGNHSGLAHCAWWGNYFSLKQAITADLWLGNTALRIGYGCNTFSSKVNDIVSRHITHTATIGVSGQWISVGPSTTLSPEAKTISATY